MSTLPFRQNNPYLLQRLLDSIEVLPDGRPGWDYMAMYDLRDALHAQTVRPVALDPVMVAMLSFWALREAEGDGEPWPEDVVRWTLETMQRYMETAPEDEDFTPRMIALIRALIGLAASPEGA